METSEMKKTVNLGDWLRIALESTDEVNTIHFDRLSEWAGAQAEGAELVEHAQSLLTSVVVFLRGVACEHRIKHALVFLPLSVSKDISFWEKKFWMEVSCRDEPPSLYLLRNVQIFDDDAEEYRCPIQAPGGSNLSNRALFRSFRSNEARNNDWEFTSGIYLIVDID